MSLYMIKSFTSYQRAVFAQTHLPLNIGQDHHHGVHPLVWSRCVLELSVVMLCPQLWDDRQVWCLDYLGWK